MMIQTDIGIQEPARQETVVHLNKINADLFVLYHKLLKYHWNIRGQHFGPLHAFFEDLYTQAFEDIDRVAERVRALGKLSPGTMEEALKLARLKEEPGRNPSDMEMIADLLNDFETIITHIRSDIKKIQESHDEGSVAMLSDMIMKLEKSAWMLRAHLEAAEAEKKTIKDVKE
ncbi:MAG: DNA starvation/stationary phase protection protein [Candidatus Babeliaceae bacterium]|nr:DNA starvation/stationary phase protection protein [Candidatus Babeliaceae bacterium]